MNNKKLRAGIIGCGGIANAKHFPALAKLNDRIELVAFCDIIEERALIARSKYGVEGSIATKDHKELLKDDSIDVVYVLTPNMAHSHLTVDALKAGKHVLCEKPMAAISADAKKMLDAAIASGKKLTIGYQNRFRKDSQMMYQVCRSGELGDIYFSKAHALRRRAVPTWGVFMDKEKQGGGALIDIGTHALDLVLWMTDNYKPVSVTGSVYKKMADQNKGNIFGPWDPEKFDVEDSAFGFIKMENGATIYLEASWVLNITDVREAKCTICGTRGGAEMLGANPMVSNLVINGEKYGNLIETTPQTTGGVAYFSGAKETEADIEAKQWLDAIVYDKQPVVKPEQAYVVTLILEAIYDSAKSGKTVNFERSDKKDDNQ